MRTKVFGLMLDIDHKELEDASLSPQGSEEGSPDVEQSPLYPVFEALPVLAHRVFHHLQEAKVGGGAQHVAHDVVDMPLLGFSVEKLMQYLTANEFATKCVAAAPALA
jgi:hypothetical protein